MIFELTLTNALSLASLFFGTLWGLLKVLGAQGEKRMVERFEALHGALAEVAEQHAKNAQATLELEREFRRHQAQTEREFVRRDDFVRHIGSLETRIDNFALKVERALDNLTRRP